MRSLSNGVANTVHISEAVDGCAQLTASYRLRTMSKQRDTAQRRGRPFSSSHFPPASNPLQTLQPALNTSQRYFLHQSHAGTRHARIIRACQCCALFIKQGTRRARRHDWCAMSLLRRLATPQSAQCAKRCYVSDVQSGGEFIVECVLERGGRRHSLRCTRRPLRRGHKYGSQHALS